MCRRPCGEAAEGLGGGGPVPDADGGARECGGMWCSGSPVKSAGKRIATEQQRESRPEVKEARCRDEDVQLGRRDTAPPGDRR